MDAWPVSKAPNPCACEDYAFTSFFSTQVGRAMKISGRGEGKGGGTYIKVRGAAKCL